MIRIALLRGINVVGNRKLPMKDLVSLLQRAGFGSVRTYIQSGNVVFENIKSTSQALHATARNWRTVNKLLEMARGGSAKHGYCAVTRGRAVADRTG